MQPDADIQPSPPSGTHDVGWTHIALAVKNMEASLHFYTDYADLGVVHERRDADESGVEVRVAWLTDARRTFVLVLAQMAEAKTYFSGFAHLGVACDSVALVDQRCARAKASGLTVRGPENAGPPIGYWAFISDPDGNNVELSYGQDVGIKLRGTAP